MSKTNLTASGGAKVAKVLTIGGAVVDIYVRSEEFHIARRADGEVYLCQSYGSKLEMDECVVLTGGGAGNVAVGLARQGHQVAILSEVGRDVWAGLVEKDLEAEGVSTKYLVREHLEATGKSVILVGRDGGRTVIVDRGASALLGEGDIPDDVMTGLDWVHLTSVNGARATVEKVLRLLALEENAGVGFSWNPGKGELKLLAQRLIEIPDGLRKAGVARRGLILFVNETEWEMIRGRREEMLRLFEIVVVTKGKSGGTIYQNGAALFDYPITENIPVDETGAGDAFGTGFIGAILAGRDLQTAADWGLRNGSSVVQQLGAKAGLLGEF